MKGIMARLIHTVGGFLRRCGAVRIVAFLAAVAVLLVAGRYGISWLHLSAQDFDDPVQNGLAESLGEIPAGKGEVQVAQQDALTMYVDTETLDIRLVDSTTGKEFHTLSENSSTADRARSPLTLFWQDENGQTGEWDAYTYAIARGQYTIEKIKNGVRFALTLSPGETYVVSDYLPSKITTERYQSAFLDKIDALAEKGVNAATVARYRKMLSMSYRYDEAEDCYFMAYNSTPAKSTMMILIQMCEAIGYTQEDVLQDNADFGIAVQFSNPAQFRVYLENTLDNGSLLVSLPSYEAVCDNDSYTLRSVSVYPAFNCAEAAKNEGYIFVPDGAGALIQMDSGLETYGDYNRAVYNNARYETVTAAPTYTEELTMPVFGMYHTGGEQAGTGYLAVIEQGAEAASIATTLKAQKADTEGGNPYNAAYACFWLVRSSSVKVFGEFASQTAKYTVFTDRVDTDYQVRYYLFGENADYYAFAKQYRQYLTEQGDLTPRYNDEARLFVNLLGAASVEDSVMGVPYERTLSLTDYQQALSITAELSEVSAIYNYKWVFNGGRTGGWGGHTDLVSVNGKAADLQQLLAQSQGGNEIFVEANLMRMYDTDGWMLDSFHAMRGFDGEVLEFSDRFYPDGTRNLDQAFNNYRLLHPSYLTATVDAFLKNAAPYDNIALTDLGSTYYASYGNGSAVSSTQAMLQTTEPALQKLAGEKTLALHNPNANALAYCTYAVGISRESSDYGSFYTSVPFRQLTMNGITDFTTLEVNMATSSPDYFLLQALELGAIPQFTLSAEKVDELIEAGISDYYSVHYGDLKDDILAFYSTYKTAKATIGSGEIVGHRMLSEKVFETTYANGVKVLVNYNLYATEAEGHALDALGYEIVEG